MKALALIATLACAVAISACATAPVKTAAQEQLEADRKVERRVEDMRRAFGQGRDQSVPFGGM